MAKPMRLAASAFYSFLLGVLLGSLLYLGLTEWGRILWALQN